MIGILEHIDGRKLKVGDETVYLRKGVDSDQYLPLLQSVVFVDAVEEKGFQMVKEIRPNSDSGDIMTVALTKSTLITELPKPTLPKTTVEDTKPVDMPASANVPKLNFGRQENFTTATEVPHKASQKLDNRTQKDHDIMRQWAMGATLNSHALAQCNDAMALNTEQTLKRAKHIAEELLKWVVER